MKRLNLAALFGFLVVVGMASGCGEEPVEVEQRPPAVPLDLRSLLENKNETQLVATIRGPGQVGYLQPISRRDGGEMVTTFRIQNNSTGALAAFKVDEFWYDDNGDTVTGGSFRMPRPFLQGDIIEVLLRIPRDGRMARSNYEFSHKNGVIEATLFEEMDEPTEEEEEEDAEGEDEAS
ncbi:MAG: hypothetical protein VYE68_14960 [Acidobacteriota bacterium]|nr:hypothetical protein [Acidobacteriota bacterium]